ncbi:MAG: hypothetical protein ACRDYB_09995 [Acidimicrobiales bacterium]
MSPTDPPTDPPTERPDDLAKLTELAKSAVDTAVGLGVLGLQKLQVGRVELQKRLAKNDAFGAYSGLRSEAIRRAAQIDSLFTEAIRTVESTLNPVTDRLPGPAKHVATVAQARIDELHAKVSEHLAKAAAENAKAKVEAQA